WRGAETRDWIRNEACARRASNWFDRGVCVNACDVNAAVWCDCDRSGDVHVDFAAIDRGRRTGELRACAQSHESKPHHRAALRVEKSAARQTQMNADLIRVHLRLSAAK